MTDAPFTETHRPRIRLDTAQKHEAIKTLMRLRSHRKFASAVFWGILLGVLTDAEAETLTATWKAKRGKR